MPLIIGRYALFDALASGGMATVHLGRLLGPVGFGRTVAVKRLHSQFATDQEFVTMFMDEARIVARIRHPNVVPMVDVIESNLGLFLVMEYVHGESFSRLLRTARSLNEPVPIKVVSSLMHGVLLGLHAAHETTASTGELLNVVHRDVSPQNIMVGADGVARVLDFGVAKAAGRAHVTREGQIKGKLAYMAPEQIRGVVDRRADVFAVSVVLWEALAGRRLHEGAKDMAIVTRVVEGNFPRPSEFRADIPPDLEAIVMRGLDVNLENRYQDARSMALELERRVGLANPSEVCEWVEHLASDALRERARRVAAMEQYAGQLSAADATSNPDDLNGVRGGVAPAYSTGAYGQARPGESSLPSTSVTSSSYSAHTGGRTPYGAAVPAPEASRRDFSLAIAIVAFSGVLAIVGALLGGYSLYARKPPAHEPPRNVLPNVAPTGAPSRTTQTVVTSPVETAAPSAVGAEAPEKASDAGAAPSPAPSTP